MRHPTQDSLIAAAGEERVPQELQDHFDAGCLDCEFRFQSYRKIFRSFAGGRTPAAPREWIERAQRTLRGLSEPDPTTWFEAVEQSFDELATVRGRRMSAARRVWRAGPYEIDLAALEGGSLVGQVLTLEPDQELPEDAACIVYPDGDPLVVPLESNGDFRIARRPSEPFALCIEGDQLCIVIEDVRLGDVEE